MDRRKTSHSSLHEPFVVVLTLVCLGLFLAILWPVLQSLFLGALLAIFSRPIFTLLKKRFRDRRNAAAAVTVLIVFILIVGPLSALTGVIFKQAVQISDYAFPKVQEHLTPDGIGQMRDGMISLFPWLRGIVPSEGEIVRNIASAAKASGGYLVSGISAFTAGTATFLLSVFVMFYAMFFFLRDGPDILKRALTYLPLGREEKTIMLERFVSITRAMVRGSLLIGLIQGVLGGVAFYAAGIEGAAFWGLIMTVFAVIPGIGTALVWIPAVGFLFLSGQHVHAVLLAAWCAGVVATIDNILRPTLVGKDAKMPDLMILIGTLGGMILLGPIGLLVGPIICGVFLATLEIFGTLHPEGNEAKHGTRHKRPSGSNPPATLQA